MRWQMCVHEYNDEKCRANAVGIQVNQIINLFLGAGKRKYQKKQVLEKASTGKSKHRKTQVRKK